MVHLRSTRFLPLVAVLVLAPALAQEKPVVASGSTAAQFPAEAPFLSQNAAAMDKMMAAMNVKPSGDVDTDFTAMMIPHHQGAIDMAMLELRYGKNQKLRRIARETIANQQHEIAAMKLALGKPLPPSNPALMPRDGMTMSSMNMK